MIHADTDIWIPAGDAQLGATVRLPRPSRGVVVFAHGSGSSRHSPRNRMVAEFLNAGGFGTVLLDLLTAGEDQIDQVATEYRFDIELLAGRLTGTLDWLERQPDTAGLPIGLFGASTGAAAALVAAARRPDSVRAIVSRGGRPDLAGEALRHVRAPTLLVVGGEDYQVIALNQKALAVLGEPSQLVIVPGATHLFSEPGTLERVGEYARTWFDLYLDPSGPVLDGYPS